MKSIIFKSLMIVCIIIGMSNYMIYLKTGNLPTLNLPSIDWSLRLPSTEPVKQMIGEAGSGDEKVYKWTDDNGKVHYSSAQPPEVRAAKEILINPNMNVVPALDVTPEYPEPEPEPDAIVTQSAQTPSPNNANDSVLGQSLIDEAKQVQSLMDDRNKRIEKAIKEL